MTNDGRLAGAFRSSDRGLTAPAAGNGHHAPALGAGPKERQAAHHPGLPLTVDGQRYIIAGLEGADWVKNAQAAGWGIQTRGRKQEKVALFELPVEEHVPILGEFPRKVPHGVKFFETLYGVQNDPEEFAKLAPRCPVFRLKEAA